MEADAGLAWGPQLQGREGVDVTGDRVGPGKGNGQVSGQSVAHTVFRSLVVTEPSPSRRGDPVMGEI